MVYDETHDRVTIDFGTTFDKGEVDLCIDFKGILADNMVGFYRSTHKCGDKEEIILATQFEVGTCSS